MQGVLFPDRMTPQVFATVKGQLAEMEEEYLSSNPGDGVQRLTQHFDSMRVTY